MDYAAMNSLEQLIFKLTYCKGIGLIGKWKIVQFSEKFSQTEFTMAELLKIAGIWKFQSLFKQSFEAINEEWLVQKAQEQSFITWRSEEYPEELKEIPYGPLILFYEGELQLLRLPKLAFVGARTATPYASQVLQQLIPKLVTYPYTIVSGLARGVDQMSHTLAIQAGGRTIGVVGCGLDRCYPAEVQALFIEMKRTQLILSEYPRGVGVQRHHFPMRNRIIAGLGQGTCVIEAKERSGSLITAQQALEYGKEVFAVPGEIISGQSNGCHHLIQDGAKCVYTVADILDELPDF